MNPMRHGVTMPAKETVSTASAEWMLITNHSGNTPQIAAKEYAMKHTTSLTNSQLTALIDDRIHSERNRRIMTITYN